ncbi:SCO7613 C-terminal domain-containing membrane protein [Nocardioides maradonensis]
MNPTHIPPLPTTPLPARNGVSYASVPKILLGLGAFCLLAAAATFLAVSWSTLGVGGRTAVLAGLTLAAFGSTLALHRSGLRIAAEAISVVTLGFLTLDVYGAAVAGLLGDITGPVTTLLAGSLLAVAGGTFGLLTRGRGASLVAPVVISGIGVVLAYAGSVGLPHATMASALATAIGMTAVAAIALALGGTALRTASIAPIAVGSGLLGIASLIAVGYDLARWTTLAQPFSHRLVVHLDGATTPFAGWLVVPTVLVLVSTLVTVFAGSRLVDVVLLARVALPSTGVAAALALAAYDVALALPVGMVALTATALGAYAGRRTNPSYAAVAYGLVTAAVIAALPSAGLTSAASGVGALLATWLAATAIATPVRVLSEVVLVPASAATVFSLLADRHVTVVEAYTLPFAAALLVVGVLHLRRNPQAGTEALLPGLLLAIVPSTLLVLGDPISLRAGLLGAGCVAMVLAGALLRWSTPVIVGTVAGVVLVLREIGPYASTVPQWVWIGLAGVVLTLAGITWERQLRDLRRAVTMIGRLR